MSRKSTQSTSNKKQKKPLKTLKLTQPDDNEEAEPPSKRHRVGFTLSNPPIFDLTKDETTMASSSQVPADSRVARSTFQSQTTSVNVRGKGKETRTGVGDEDEDNVLWVDKYEPTSEAELAVHKRKVEDVRHWLLEAFEGGLSGKLRKYRRILALTGPAGTAKTSTIRVLSRELDFEILEWRNSVNEHGPSAFANIELSRDDELNFDTESLFDKFQAFLTRAMTCNTIFGHRNYTHRHSSDVASSYSQTQSSTNRSGKRQLVLLEDLPNLLHQPTQTHFQTALRSLCIANPVSSENPGPPIVIIVSDSGLRAEQPDDDMWDGSSSRRGWAKKEVLDVRNVLGPELLASPYVTCIRFNPIAPTLMTKALQALLASHYESLEAHDRGIKQPPREVIDVIVESSNGDIRSAIMALQFACVVDLPASSIKLKGKATLKNAQRAKRTTNVRAVLEAVTRREQSLVLFHLMGKILYNKRKSDPPAVHLSAKDIAKERELDTQLIDPLPLPEWFSHHDRKASRVCTETMVAESPIDSSLLGLYIHQNYTQFCTDIDQCDGICEGLSWVDSIAVLSTNSPYSFPTLTLSTLHSLPTPVPRKGQKVCKPTWFDVHTKELEALDAVGDVLGWLGRDGAVCGVAESSMSVGKWTHADVAMELGGWLRTLDRHHAVSIERGLHPQPPRTHRLFSHLPWSVGAAGADTLGEHEDGELEDEEEDMRLPGGMRGEEESKGWLEDDDIEDVE